MLELRKLLPNSADKRSSHPFGLVSVEFPPHRPAKSKLVDILSLLDGDGLSIVADQQALLSLQIIQPRRVQTKALTDHSCMRRQDGDH